MPIVIGDTAQNIIKMLNSGGFDAFAVGGCVRDKLMGNDATDYDITTNALPQQIKEIFYEYKIIETGIKHGTVTVVMDDMPFEITTFRTESSYSDSRHPDYVNFVSSLTEDLSRRDFTMNAIAYAPEIGIVDPFGGCKDIKNRLIRTVGDPQKRFSEDSLRILRALRFTATLGFEIESETAKSIELLVESVLKVSPERIYTELKKMLLGKYSFDVINKFKDAIAKIVPLSKDLSKLSAIPNDFSMRLYYLCGDEVINVLNYLRADNETKRKSGLLLESKPIPHDRIEQKIYISALGREDAKYVAKYRCISYDEEITGFMEIINSDDCLSIKELNVNGNDLIGLGIKGSNIKRYLHILLMKVIKGNVKNEYDDLMQYIKNIDIL